MQANVWIVDGAAGRRAPAPALGSVQHSVQLLSVRRKWLVVTDQGVPSAVPSSHLSIARWACQLDLRRGLAIARRQAFGLQSSECIAHSSPADVMRAAEIVLAERWPWRQHATQDVAFNATIALWGALKRAYRTERARLCTCATPAKSRSLLSEPARSPCRASTRSASTHMTFKSSKNRLARSDRLTPMEGRRLPWCPICWCARTLR